jgi:Mu-like prophage I protein
MIDEKILKEVRALQKANPSMSYDRAWDLVESRRSALPNDIGAAVKAIQASYPGITFEEAWDLVEAELAPYLKDNPEFTLGQALVLARKQHPELTEDGHFLVTCQHTMPLVASAPSVIQYMPAGRTTLTPSVNGSAKTITVNVTPRTASKLQADLQKLLQDNAPRPFIDFDHAGGQAAAIPRRFSWQEGQGVMLNLEWTSAGESAIAGRNYSYFSPCFLIDETGDPSALPQTGAIGSLVNNPAFRNLARIAARQ